MRSLGTASVSLSAFVKVTLVTVLVSLWVDEGVWVWLLACVTVSLTV